MEYDHTPNSVVGVNALSAAKSTVVQSSYMYQRSAMCLPCGRRNLVGEIARLTGGRGGGGVVVANFPRIWEVAVVLRPLKGCK